MKNSWSSYEIASFTNWHEATIRGALKSFNLARPQKRARFERFGWKKVRGQLLSHQKQQLILDKMHRSFKQGQSHYGIAIWLNNKGIKTINGKQWDHSSVKRVLERERLKGEQTDESNS